MYANEQVMVLDVNDPAPFPGLLITFGKADYYMDCCDEAVDDF
jgi:hypothetical protein